MKKQDIKDIILFIVIMIIIFSGSAIVETVLNIVKYIINVR